MARAVGIVTEWSSGNLVFKEKVAGSGKSVIFGASSAGTDMTWYGNTASADMIWDASADKLIFDNADINLGDNDLLTFGDGSAGDVRMSFDGSNLNVTALADDEGWIFGNGTNNFDVTVYGSNSTNLIASDASNDDLHSVSVDFWLKDNTHLSWGTGSDKNGDVKIEWNSSGTTLDMVAAANNTVWKIGTGSSDSFDVRMYGTNTTNYLWWDASANSLKQNGTAELAIGRHSMANVTAKTTDYSVTAADTGSVFTTTGASATVTFTLPVKTSGLAYWFINTVDYNMVVAANTADTMVTFNDATADSVAFSTSSEKIGGAVRVFCDGTKWIALPFGTKSTGTMTVNT